METHTYNLTEMMNAGVDFLNIVISKDDLLKQDISTPMKTLQQLIASPNTASYFMERVDTVTMKGVMNFGKFLK